jgi:putative hydrolase of the HAD superfamily
MVSANCVYHILSNSLIILWGGPPLAQVGAIFWDVGGVLLSNAWDRTQREAAMQRFELDPVEFDDRHDMLVSSFERGKLTLREYLERTVFYRPRPFTPQDFEKFMFSLSQPNFETLELARALSRSRKYLMATINNESRELNEIRIQAFGLRDIFSLFVSSCFVGLRKPEDGIYRLALEVTQRPAQECCFVDDRALNLDAAARLGMHTIKMEDAQQLKREFEKLEIVP